jgi:hypothetical protein
MLIIYFYESAINKNSYNECIIQFKYSLKFYLGAKIALEYLSFLNNPHQCSLIADTESQLI